MLTSVMPESKESISQYSSPISAVNMGKRQDSSCLEGNDKSNSDTDAVPSASLSSYGTNDSPTVTMTMTLYSAGEVTSTTSDAAAAARTSGKEEGTPNSPSLSLNAAPFVGVVFTSSSTGSTPANSPSDGTSRTIGTSTIYNTVTVTSTRMSITTVHNGSPLITLASLTGSNFTSSAAPLISLKTHAATASANSTSHELPARSQGGTIAGATLGSMAAFAMIGFLIWYCCAKKRGKRKIKIKFNLKRRKPSTAKTPQLEDQTMEETRRIMLDRSTNLSDLLRDPPAQSSHSSVAGLPGDVGFGLKRSVSQAESSRTHPSWIGIAMTSSTPPNTPLLPRSNSQRSTKITQSFGSSPSERHPATLMPGFGSQQMPASLMPTPLRPAMRPAPIITSQSLARPEHVSPLSPRGMLSAVSNTTTRARRRASQALSPGAYQRVSDDGPGGFGAPKRRDSKARNPELEIGHQADKNWEGAPEGWI